MRGKFRKLASTALAGVLAVSMCPLVAPEALADTNPSYWYSTASIITSPYDIATMRPGMLTTYGVRAGSAGPDFLGITNTNFDFSDAGAYSEEQYAGFSAEDLVGVRGAGLALWATGVNENPNPFFANLLYNALNGSFAIQATTWSGNPDSSSWGDSFGLAAYNQDYDAVINGLEYSPDIIFGANKATNWGNFSAANTNIGRWVADHASSGYSPTFTNNDSTNAWTQVYTLGVLGTVADGMKDGGKTTRYDGNSATAGALSYEKAIRGNLLYVASQIDSGKVEKKKVAYLYCLAGNTGYFFTPKADGLISGADTGDAASSSNIGSEGVSGGKGYASNNATVDLDYLGVLPFVTDTFDGGEPMTITMMVEDILKANPAVAVSGSASDALADVDVIIYNTTTLTNLQGGNGGKNYSGVGYTYSGDQGSGNATRLSDNVVSTWAKKLGFEGEVVAGDDWGTSSNQGFGVVSTTEHGMAPLLYCQRNYTTDKPARIAWAFAHVYPELYPNEDASYSYWVDNVYHVKIENVPAVVKYMTNQSDSVTYTNKIAAKMERNFQAGLTWWNQVGSKKADWAKYAYYNGSSRASYYDGKAASEEPANTIGIMAPSSIWQASAEQVDFAALASGIEDAEAELDAVTASADGKDVAVGSKWVEAAQMAAMEKAVDRARAVAADYGSTQSEVDAAAEGLATALASFKDKERDGKAGASSGTSSGSSSGASSGSSSGGSQAADPGTSSGTGTGTGSGSGAGAGTSSGSGSGQAADPGTSSGSGSGVAADAESGSARPEGEAVAWKRLYGQTALDTMAAIAQEGFESADTVVVATSDGYWDALAASALAGVAKAPILLTDKAALSSQAASEIDRLGVSRAYVVGGTAAISKAVETQLKAKVKKVTRLAGATAVGTAEAISAEAVRLAAASDAAPNTCIVSTANGFYDALSAAPVAYAKGYPVYMTEFGTNELSASTRAAIKAAGYDRAIIVGGPAAVSSTVEGQLAAAGLSSYVRLWGADAWHTSAAIADFAVDELEMSADKVGVADGNGYWDALTGAALCGRNGAALVLVPRDGTTSDGYEFSYDPYCIDAFVAKRASSIASGYVFGGPAAVPESTMAALESATA